MNQPWPSPAAHEEPAQFSVEEFMRLATEGPLAEWPGKIELVGGVIVRMAPANYPHTSYQRQVTRKLDAIFGDGLGGYIVAPEVTVRLGDRTVRDPDVAVFLDPEMIEGIIDRESMLLVVEIADSSLDVDLGPKRGTYAAAGVPHYWVVDIRARQVHAMHGPENGDYTKAESVAFGSAMPVPGADASITID